MKTKTTLSSLILLILLSLLVSCAGKSPKAVSTLNSDVLHTENGFMLLKRKHYGFAKKEFDKATNFNEKYSRAYMGKAIVYLHQKMLNEAYEELQKALKYATTSEDILKTKSGLIQFYSSPEFVGRHHGKNAWLVMAKQEFDGAREIRKSEEIYYYMAIAYTQDFQFRKADKLLDEILKSSNSFTLRAKEEKTRIRSIARIVEKYPEGKKVILDSSLTRGQLSYALIEMFHIDKKIKEKNTSIRLIAKDALGSPYSESVMKVINLELNGLTILSDKTFRPNKRVNRAELASFLHELKKRLHIGLSGAQGQGFSDVNSNDWFYESVTFASRCKLLSEKDTLTMEFRPLDDASALEALDALDKLLNQN